MPFWESVNVKKFIGFKVNLRLCAVFWRLVFQALALFLCHLAMLFFSSVFTSSRMRSQADFLEAFCTGALFDLTVLKFVFNYEVEVDWSKCLWGILLAQKLLHSSLLLH